MTTLRLICDPALIVDPPAVIAAIEAACADLDPAGQRAAAVGDAREGRARAADNPVSPGAGRRVGHTQTGAVSWMTKPS